MEHVYIYIYMYYGIDNAECEFPRCTTEYLYYAAKFTRITNGRILYSRLGLVWPGLAGSRPGRRQKLRICGIKDTHPTKRLASSGS